MAQITHKKISLASTNGTLLTSRKAAIVGLLVSNVNAAARYLKLYDIAIAPVVGTDVPKLTLGLPGTQPMNTGGALPPSGIQFNNGIAYAMTTGNADGDTGAVGAGDILLNLIYEERP